MIFKKYNLFLEAFQAKDKESVIDNIVSYIETKTNIQLFAYYETFHVKKQDLLLEGQLFLSLERLAIRINWIKSDRLEIHSIDLWEDFKFDTTPTSTLLLNGLSVIKSLPSVVSFITNQTLVTENTDIDKQIDDLRGKMSRARSQVKKDEYQEKISKLEIQKGQPETTETDTTNKVKGIIDTDPKMDVFKQIELNTRQVAKGKSNSLLIIGQSGLGKTQVVTSTLNDMKLFDENGYVKVSGDISTAGLYQILFVNRNQLLVFDDCDAVFDNVDSINILAAALDTYERRTISNIKRTYYDASRMTDQEMQERYDADNNKLPNKFIFTGRIIFVSNKKKDKFDPKFLSRTLTVNVALTKDEVVQRMKDIIQTMMTDKPLYKKMEAFDYLLSVVEKQKYYDGLNIRTLIHAVNIRCNEDNDELIVIDGKSYPAWKLLIKQSI